MENNYAVELRGIGKTYPGSTQKANSNISLGIRRGEILCIAGENGAGKTTLMKILNGLETPSEGEIAINGNTVNVSSPQVARSLGLGMVHQHFMLFPEYTVAENIVMGMEPRKWGLFVDGAKAVDIASGIIDAHGFSIVPDKPVRTLTVGEMQQVEICRLLYRNADIIILDEPSAVLTEQEVDALFSTLRALAAEGKSLFIITHKLKEIKLIGDRVAVLRHGELVGICDTKSTDEYEISRMMVGGVGNIWGGVQKNETDENSLPLTKPVITFDNVTVMRRGQRQPLLDEVSFSVRPGEIVGFAGVGGNGLGALEAILGGFLCPSSGKVTHNGKDISLFNARRLRRQGLAYVPSDRIKVGSAMSAAVYENTIVGRRNEFSKMGFLDNKAIRKFCTGLLNRYGISGATKANTAAMLSGGNLQKLILAREIDQFMDYIVFSEPTWGLDIRASAFIMNEIAGLREKGAAVILISTNLDEILALANRIIVMYRGGIAAEFENDASKTTLKHEICNRMQGLK